MPDPRKWLLPVYWVALIVATHYPRVQIPDEIPKGDKLIHFTAFGILALLFWLFLATRRLTARSVWLAALVLIPYAALDEYTQQFVGRHSDIADWVANVGGITTALAVLEIRRRRKPVAKP